MTRFALAAALFAGACWTSSKASGPAFPQEPAADSDATTGGSGYGGSTYAEGGILGILRQQDDAGFVSVFGSGDLSSGLDDTDVYGGLLGNDPAPPGLSDSDPAAAGRGTGGGGTGWGTIGTGSYGQIGSGSGTGSGYGRPGGMRPRPAVDQPVITLGTPTIQGDFDKNILRRYVRRYMNRLRYCYERQLLVSPTLAGTVTARFTIAPGGKVTSSTATGVDAELAGCVSKAIAAIEFAKPRGGKVDVTYPIVFRPAPSRSGSGGTGWGTIGAGSHGQIGSSSGSDDADIYGGPFGNAPEDDPTRTPGGGSGSSTIATRSYGQIGSGSGAGSGYGRGKGGLKDGGSSIAPSVSLGRPTLSGNLDKEKHVIRRYLSRELPKLRYCYERQLSVTPSIAGQLVARFTIDANGRVIRSTANGVHANVEGCVARTIHRIQFAKPQGGGELDVTYPIAFRP
jgi:hypothetical protein